jgi:hypothetical protein
LESSGYFPHLDVVLQAMRISRERLNGRSKVAIDAKLLRRILQCVAMHLPFQEEFYRRSYPDIAQAAAAGHIPDLHRHFVETGFFEGRLGAPPPVDEAFYCATYKDVAAAIARGEVRSGAEHYLRSGAAEGRVPSADLKPEIDGWMGLLRVATLTET